MKALSLAPPDLRGCSRGRGSVGLWDVLAVNVLEGAGESRKPPDEDISFIVMSTTDCHCRDRVAGGDWTALYRAWLKMTRARGVITKELNVRGGSGR